MSEPIIDELDKNINFNYQEQLSTELKSLKNINDLNEIPESVDSDSISEEFKLRKTPTNQVKILNQMIQIKYLKN